MPIAEQPALFDAPTVDPLLPATVAGDLAISIHVSARIDYAALVARFRTEINEQVLAGQSEAEAADHVIFGAIDQALNDALLGELRALTADQIARFSWSCEPEECIPDAALDALTPRYPKMLVGDPPI